MRALDRTGDLVNVGQTPLEALDVDRVMMSSPKEEFRDSGVEIIGLQVNMLPYCGGRCDDDVTGCSMSMARV